MAVPAGPAAPPELPLSPLLPVSPPGLPAGRRSHHDTAHSAAGTLPLVPGAVAGRTGGHRRLGVSGIFIYSLR